MYVVSSFCHIILDNFASVIGLRKQSGLLSESQKCYKISSKERLWRTKTGRWSVNSLIDLKEMMTSLVLRQISFGNWHSANYHFVHYTFSQTVVLKRFLEPNISLLLHEWPCVHSWFWLSDVTIFQNEFPPIPLILEASCTV